MRVSLHFSTSTNFQNENTDTWETDGPANMKIPASSLAGGNPSATAPTTRRPQDLHRVLLNRVNSALPCSCQAPFCAHRPPMVRGTHPPLAALVCFCDCDAVPVRFRREIPFWL